MGLHGSLLDTPDLEVPGSSLTGFNRLLLGTSWSIIRQSPDMVLGPSSRTILKNITFHFIDFEFTQHLIG